jgi:hypothetical protein
MKATIFLKVIILSASHLLWSHAATAAAATHDFCESDDNCLNGGRCRTVDEGVISYKYCQCLDGFGGSRCEHYCPLQCQNGGYCFRSADLSVVTPVLNSKQDLDLSDYSCKCLGHFIGTVCQVPYENCADGSRCLFGGTCQNADAQALSTPSCACPPGYGGSSCEIEGLPESEPILPFERTGRITFSMFLGIFAVGVFFALSLYVYRRHRYKTVSVKEDFSFVPSIGSDKQWQNVV